MIQAYAYVSSLHYLPAVFHNIKIMVIQSIASPMALANHSSQVVMGIVNNLQWSVNVASCPSWRNKIKETDQVG